MMRSRLKRLISIACTMSCASLAGGQNLPDTLWIPVIFYDYHADPATRDFQSCATDLRTNVVKNSLTASRKPIANPAHNAGACAYHVDQWYRPSGADGPSTNSHFGFNSETLRWEWTNLVPRPGGTPGEYVATDYDPNYNLATIVIYDSLPFVLMETLGEGACQFSRTGEGEDQFFWIDGRGHEEELGGGGHNYAFTMELHHRFTYVPGLTFDFGGDDDIWVFVNDSLVVDLGGVHTPVHGSLEVDSIRGLEVGKNYHLDFFYAERHTFASTIRITTNILTPMKLEIIDKDDTISAGSLARLEAAIRDSAGNRQTDKEALVTWELGDTAPGDSLTVGTGATTQIGASKAYRRVRVDAKYIDPNVPTFVHDGSAYVYITPGPPSHVWIEQLTNDPVTSLNEPDTVARISLSPAEDSARAYAVLRDLFGNYVGFARKAQWHSDSPGAIAVSPREGSNWVGIITRGDAPNEIDSTVITASQEGLDSDQVRVVAEGSLQAAHPRFFSAADPGSGELRMYDLKGRVVLRKVVPGEGSASFHSLNIVRPPTIPGGVYCVGSAGGKGPLIRRVIAAE